MLMQNRSNKIFLIWRNWKESGKWSSIQKNVRSFISTPTNDTRDTPFTGSMVTSLKLLTMESILALPYDDFSWHRHIDSVAAKASRTLGFLRRNLGQCTKEVKSTAYTSLVRPVLEYASPAWDPSSSEGIVKLEKVQTKTDSSLCPWRDPGCVTRMVNDLGWETLESRRKKDRLTTLYKIWHGLVDMDTGDVLRLNDRRTSGQQRLYQPTANVKVYKDSFFPRTTQDWNRLPAVVTDSPTIEEFRRLPDAKRTTVFLTILIPWCFNCFYPEERIRSDSSYRLRPWWPRHHYYDHIHTLQT